MRKLLLSLLVFLLIAPSAWAALSANTVWEYRTATGSSNNNGGGAVWIDLTVPATYKWTVSGSGTNEYYLEALAGGDPGITFTDSGNKTSVMVDGNFNLATEGTKGSLTAGTYDYGDNDSLGYSTIYVRLSDGTDPDTKPLAGKFFQVGLLKGGGHDWAQQAAPQYALTGCTSVGAGAIILNANAAADMVGNVLNVVSGTNFTAGRYEIISVVAGVSITVDTNCTTGAGLNGVVNVGGSMITLTDAIFESFIGGNIVFIKNDGSYTLGASIAKTTNLPTQSTPIIYYGYLSTRGDNPAKISCPAIVCGAYTVSCGLYSKFYNLYMTGSALSVLTIPGGGLAENCKLINISTTASRYPALPAGESSLHRCEMSSMAGIGVNMGSGGTRVVSCYIHDCGVAGINQASYDYNQFIHNIINECPVGINSGTASIINSIYGNTIYLSDKRAASYGIGTTSTASYGWFIVNNIIQGFAVGIDWNDVDYSHFIDYNNFYNNTADLDGTPNVIFGSHNIFTDPQFKNPQGTLVEDAEDAWNEYAGTGVTATADAAVFKVGTYAAKAACDATTGVEVVMTEAIPATDMSGYGGIRLWAQSSVALNAGDWQLLLDDSPNCATPVVTMSFPAMLAGTWYWIYLNNTSFASATGIVSIGLKQAVDKGAMNFYVDNVRASDCDFTLGAGSGAINAGLQVGTTEGLKGTYKQNIGPDGSTGGSDIFGWVQ